jgi:hypothetical protein
MSHDQGAADVERRTTPSLDVQDEQNANTVTPQRLVPQGLARRRLDTESCGLPAWPRLMALEMACQYVGLSADMLRSYVKDGSLPVVRPARPRTRRARGYRLGKSRRQLANKNTLRRTLFDRVDLDLLIDRWKREGA